jgi:hypothetical protein
MALNGSASGARKASPKSNIMDELPRPQQVELQA